MPSIPPPSYAHAFPTLLLANHPEHWGSWTPPPDMPATWQEAMTTLPPGPLIPTLLTSRWKRQALGQVDLSMMSPGVLSALMSQQQNRRRGYAGTLLTSGLGEAEPRRKTLLGA